MIDLVVVDMERLLEQIELMETYVEGRLIGQIDSIELGVNRLNSWLVWRNWLICWRQSIHSK